MIKKFLFTYQLARFIRYTNINIMANEYLRMAQEAMGISPLMLGAKVHE